jgi:hypothetical protein
LIALSGEEMSVRAILENHKLLEKNIEEIIKYGLRLMERSSTSFNVKEKTIIIEGLLLRACAYWERFLEAEVIFLIELEQSKLREYLELPSIQKLNRQLIKAILFSDSYRSFQDIEKSKGFFRSFIANNYNLFNKLTKGQIRKNQMTYKLRNYLAHYSEFAKKKLQQQYKKTYSYSRFMQPGRFLMKENGKHFEDLIHNFCLMSATMKRSLI